MIPDYLPWPLALVYISGVAELVLGVGLIIRKTSQLAAWGLIGLLIAVFPANLNMAMHPDQFVFMSSVMLWLRLPVQGLLILWAFRYTKPDTLSQSSPQNS